MTNISPPHVYAYIAMFKVDMGPGCYNVYKIDYVAK